MTLHMTWRMASIMVLAVAGIAALPAGAVPPNQPKINPMASQVKAVADAKAALDKAQAQVLAIRKRVSSVFELRPDFRAAKENLETSKAEYEAASKSVQDRLHLSAEYKALVARRDKAQALLDGSARRDIPSSDDAPKLTDEEVAAAGHERADAGTAIKKMERDAEQNDASFLSAKQKYTEARQTWDNLQAQVDDALKLDPEYAPAEQAVTQAETNYKTARDAMAAASRSQHPAPIKH